MITLVSRSKGMSWRRWMPSEVSSWSKLKTIHDSGADPVDFFRGMATVMGDIYVQK